MKIEEAMKLAGKIADEIPHLIQPSSADHAIVALRREVLKLRKDKERLDFMQNNLKGRVCISSSDADGVITFHAIGSGLRAAIDHAMKERKK